MTGATLVGIAGSGSAAAGKGKPNFGPRLWGDGERWGTKVTGKIQNPKERSLDKLFVITNSSNPDGQLPVSEAAPGNDAYNGGRWWTHTVRWTDAGFDAHGTVPVLTRYGPASDPASIQYHLDRGHLEITAGAPSGGPPDYFRCPLLPAKDE